MRLTGKQRELLGQFFCNYSIAWIAGGIVGPYISGWQVGSVATSWVAAVNVALSVYVMLLLIR